MLPQFGNDVVDQGPSIGLGPTVWPSPAYPSYLTLELARLDNKIIRTYLKLYYPIIPYHLPHMTTKPACGNTDRPRAVWRLRLA